MKRIYLNFIALIVSLIVLLITVNAAAATTEQPFTPEQTQAIEKITHDYLVQNPQVLVQVFRSLQEKQQAQMMQQAIQAIASNAKQLFDASISPVIGNPKAKVALVEFFDYQCPHCKKVAPIIAQLIKANPDLKIIYKEIPIFPNSAYISKAALAAQQQDKYIAFHNALMQAQAPIKKTTVMKLAEQVGLNVKQLEKDMQSKNISAELDQNITLVKKIGIMGTPAFIIHGRAQGNDPNKVTKTNTFYVPGQVPKSVLQKFISQANKSAEKSVTPTH